MISEKMRPMLENNSAIRAMFEEGKRLSAIYGADQVYDFSLGNPNVPAPEHVKQVIFDVLNEEESTMIHGYMSNAGFEDVRTAIADSLNRRFGTAFGAQHILMTVGAAGGLNVILKTILNPGDQVIVFAPYFVEYGSYVRNYEGELVVITPNTETFQPNLAEFEAKIGAKTKAVLINTPNNPTGVVYSEETLQKMAKILTDKEAEFGTDIVLISDEPYRELVYDGTAVPFVTKYYPNTVVVYSYSKSLSLPGERIGYLLIPKEVTDSDEVFAAACIANRVSGSVNA
ncbi:MAG: pyridoxal phosphate-dependent aminotransferase, partial [Hungatella sp.]